jgi:FKBP-type peptidyl-prolyl cis-trans isomerase (trigger factor)
MRNTVKNILEQKAEEKLQAEKRNQVNQFLVDNTSFELPQSLIQEEKNFRLNQQLANPRFKVKWNKLSDKEKKQIEEDLEKQANISIKLFYLSKKIIEDHKIVISPEEVKHLALSIKRTQNESDLNRNDMANAYSHLLLFKAQDYILEQSAKKS